MSTVNDQAHIIPPALEEYVTLPEIGGELLVFEGQFTLKAGEKECGVDGKVFYSFCEKIQLLMEGEVDGSGAIVWFGGTVDLIIDGSFSGRVFIERNQGERIWGSVYHLENKRSSSCVSFRWCYFNAPKIFGDGVRRGRNVATDRLVFQAGGYQVMLVFNRRKGIVKSLIYAN